MLMERSHPLTLANHFASLEDPRVERTKPRSPPIEYLGVVGPHLTETGSAQHEDATLRLWEKLGKVNSTALVDSRLDRLSAMGMLSTDKGGRGMNGDGRNRKLGLTLLVAALLVTVVGIPWEASLARASTGTLVQAGTATPMAMLAGLRAIDYYPAQNGWTYLWTRFDAAEIDADFAKIATFLHANTVRIGAQPSAFGYPRPRPRMLSELSRVITMAASHGLRVQMTLFGFWKRYSDIAGSKLWAHAIVSPYAGDPRIAFIELQNEINPTNATAMTWGQTMLPYLKQIDGAIPVTVSVTGDPTRLKRLRTALRSKQPDFYDWHYYGFAENAQAAFAKAKALAGSRPLLIGESGRPTSVANGWGPDGLEQTQGAQEAYQDYYLRAVQYAAQQAGLPPVMPWIYSDFTSTAIPFATSANQYSFGLYRTDGSAKPAAGSMGSFFAGNPISLDINNGFEQGDALPFLWRIYSASGAQFARDCTVAHSGSCSARISQDTGIGLPEFVNAPINGHVSPGQVVTASAWVRGQNATGNTKVVLFWYSAGGVQLGWAVSDSLPTGTTSWMQLTATGTAPAGADHTEIALQSGQNTGTVWFDDVTYRG